MRLAFMGSPDFAVPALRALHAAGHEIAAVYCQQPRPAGRGQSLRPCPVHKAAEALGLEVRTPVRLRTDAEAQQAFAALDLDVAVVAAYGLILPQTMLDAPKRGCLNIHASLLPRWRGAGPIQASVLAGDTETGITIMQMEAGLDTARLVLRALAENPPPTPQPEVGVTYAPKLTREDGRIDWTHSATEIDRRIRAFTPWPGTFSTLGGETLKILSAVPADGSGTPGTVLDARLTIACGSGAIRLVRVQLPGRQAMDADALLRGRPIPPGTVLE